jgi:uncharacterized protein (TIGR03437 family)
MYLRALCSLSVILLVTPVIAQTTSFSGTFTVNDQPDTDRFFTGFVGTGQIGTLGVALLSMNMNQQLADDNKSGFGQAAAGLNIFFSRSDTIVINTSGIPDPTQASISVTGRINTGTGMYAGITNPAPTGPTVTLTLVRTSTSPLRYNLSVTGNAALGGQTIGLAITNVPFTQTNTFINVFGTTTGNGTMTPGGAAQLSLNVTPAGSRLFDASAKFIEVAGTITLSQADTIKFFFTFTGNAPTLATPILITGGTGAYAGVSGTAKFTNLTFVTQSNTTLTMTGSITQPGPTTPLISVVGTANYGLNRIAQNAWTAIKGTHLVPATTPAGGVFWSNAPEFLQGKMPTQLGGISVTVNGKPAYIWWFCSAATTPTCAQDQINILTPLDDATDQQDIVVVKNGADSSPAFLVPKDDVNPAVLAFDVPGHAVATHLDASLLGPTSLYPGLSTPGKRGETVTLWTTGFGLPTTALVDGSATQTGSLPATPACLLGGAPVSVTAILVSPGLYILNIGIPSGATVGDNWFYCTYNNSVVPGVLVAVQ